MVRPLVVAACIVAVPATVGAILAVPAAASPGNEQFSSNAPLENAPLQPGPDIDIVPDIPNIPGNVVPNIPGNVNLPNVPGNVNLPNVPGNINVPNVDIVDDVVDDIVPDLDIVDDIVPDINVPNIPNVKVPNIPNVKVPTSSPNVGGGGGGGRGRR